MTSELLQILSTSLAEVPVGIDTAESVLSISRAMVFISTSRIPLVVTAGVPRRIPAGRHGACKALFLRSIGIVFLFTMISAVSSILAAMSPSGCLF